MTTLTDVPVPIAYAPTGHHRPRGPFLPLLALLFIGSGCAALIYEIVWLQLLQLVIGASAISLGVLLGTFMGGMCLGSLLLSRFVPRTVHPLMVYAILEGLIGVCGLLALVAVPTLGDLYTKFALPGATSVFLRALIAGICLLPPTLLMGATLPAIGRYVESSPKGVSWLGFFYGGNILGAVCGCLLAGFYLLRLYDMPTATYVAFGINLLVASLAFGLSLVAPHKVSTAGAETKSAPADAPVALPGEQGPALLIYVVIGLSGLTGLGAEVVWTRLLSLMLGATVYTFSIILAVFLFGLGIGSTAGAAIARNSHRPRTALAVCQFLLALAIAWAANAVARSLPFWPIDPSMSPTPWVTFQIDMARALWTILPAAILWGASFPIALASVPARRNADPGALVGRVYAANTVGAIAGALGFSVLVIPWIGTQHAQQLLMGLCLVSALIATLPLFNLAAAPRTGAIAIASTLVAACIGIMTMSRLQEVAWSAVAFGRNSATWLNEMSPAILTDEELGVFLHLNEGGMAMQLDDKGQLTYVNGNVMPSAAEEAYLTKHRAALLSGLNKELAARVDSERTASTLSYNGKIPERYCTYIGEGMNVSVAITYAPRRDGTVDDNGSPNTFRYFHGAGKVQASSDPPDMRLQRSLGHLTALVHGNPKNVLVVACGAGVTAGSFVPYDSVEKITICDIEPMVPAHVAPMFWKENHNVVGGDPREPKGDKRTVVVLDDGRHFVRTTKEKFDIITSDPIDPWVKGCAALNTIEYYQMCKEHLNPGGVMALWIPLYENNSDSAKSIIATFFKVFPNGILWSNDITSGTGYDAVLFGTPDARTINVDEIQAFLDSHPKVSNSLKDVGFGKDDPSGMAVDLLSSFAADATHLKPWTDGAQLNEDKNLRLQYLAGMWLNKQIQKEILDEILTHYAFPADIFKGSPESIRSLKEHLQVKKRIPADVRSQLGGQ